MMSSTLTQWFGLYSAHPRLGQLLRGYGAARLWFNNDPVYTQIKTQLQVNVIVGEGCQELSLIDTGASDTPIS